MSETVTTTETVVTAPDAGVATPPIAETKPEAKAAPEGVGNLMADAKPEAPTEAEGATETTEKVADKPPEPVVYDFKLPEGVAKDDPMLGAYTEAVAEAKLPVEAAQAVLDKLAPKLAEALQAPYRAWNDLQTKWQAEVKADPEIGGAKLAQTLGQIAKLRDDPRFCDPGLSEALNATGAGNHPAVIKTFAKFAALYTEGGLVAAIRPATRSRTDAEVLYPSMATS